jgi:hypothetical protein
MNAAASSELSLSLTINLYKPFFCVCCRNFNKITQQISEAKEEAEKSREQYRKIKEYMLLC